MNFFQIEYNKDVLKEQIKNIKDKFKNCSEMKEKYHKDKKTGMEPEGTQLLFERNPMLLSAMGRLTFAGEPAAKWIREMPFGDFVVDFAIATEDESQIALIEFEPAEKNAVFVPKNEKGKDPSYQWSEVLEHGCGQLYDWMYYDHDAKQTEKYRNLFDCDSPQLYYIIVLGWKKDIPKKLFKRLDWRKNSLVMDSNKISIYCYDELIEQIEKTLNY